MTACTRYEAEGLLLEERGEALPEHLSTCPDCRRAREAYAALRADLAQVGRSDLPPENWRETVRAQIRERGGRPATDRSAAKREGSRTLGGAPRFRRWVLPSGLAAAALLLLALLPLLRQAPWKSLPTEPFLTASILPGTATTLRGHGEAQPGDVLQLEATFPDTAYRELRLYHNDRELVARCTTEGSTDSDPCRLAGHGLRLRLPLTPGRYQAVLLASDAPLPAPALDLDTDTAAALAAGARIRVGDEIRVR
ncbi:MAG: hypothetical protein KDD47_16930 [Acidobacteria bacterium]|nr:hypothetical protein [Acidobacteriota bacterium]